MKLRQFEYLCMLKEYGSISRVAEASYTSQPAVSIAIKELETELGYPLLRRTNRGTIFTDHGELVLAQAQIIMEALERINSISVCNGGELLGTLRIGALPHLCNTLLLNIQMELQDQYPGFTLQLEGLESHILLRSLERESLNLVIVQECDFDTEEFEQKLKGGKLRFTPLFEDTLTFVVAEGHPLLAQESVRLTDISNYPFCVFGDGENRYVMQLTNETGYPSNIRRFYETIRMRKYMERYHAVTVLPRRAIVHGNMNYRIKFVPLPLKELNWKTRIGWMHMGEDLTSAEKIVIERLNQQCTNPEFLQLP